jgi:uncharacterized membrane protein YhaH (DUF805 family)
VRDQQANLLEEMHVQLVTWCLLSFRGEINRQAFFLGLVLCIILSRLTEPLIKEMIMGERSGWTDKQMLLAQAKVLFANNLIVLWPTLALYTKRVRDIGLPSWSLLVFFSASGSILLLAPLFGVLLMLAYIIFLVSAPTGFVRRRR